MASPFLRAGAFIVMSAFVACGPSGGGSVPPTIGPAIAPESSATSTGNTSTSAATTLPTTTFAGITTSVQIPQTSSVVTITEIVSAGPPSGTPALSVDRIAGTAQTAKRGLQAATQTTILYVELLPSAIVTIDGTPGLSFTLPSIAAGTTYYLASYETAGATVAWVAPAEGPGNVTGTTVSFPLTTGSIVITPTSPVVVALYSVAAGGTPNPVSSGSPLPVASASPSPAASTSAAPGANASPTPGFTSTPAPNLTPTPSPVVAPTTLTFDANAPATSAFTVTEAGATAAFSAAITCAPAPTPTPSGMATPSPAPAPFVAQLGATTATPSNGVATFSVTSGNDAGVCSIVVTDANGNSATETVDVTLTTLGLFATHRNTR